MLSDRCLSCLCVLSVTLVYCGQMVGWMIYLGVQLGMEVGLSAMTLCVRWESSCQTVAHLSYTTEHLLLFLASTNRMILAAVSISIWTYTLKTYSQIVATSDGAYFSRRCWFLWTSKSETVCHQPCATLVHAECC